MNIICKFYIFTESFDDKQLALLDENGHPQDQESDGTKLIFSGVTSPNQMG